MDDQTAFLTGLLELQYGEDVEEKLHSLANKVPWAKGWPQNDVSFWNAEAFMWSRKISDSMRDIIKEELSFLEGKRNLDVGCGAYSYISSVGVDFSPKMLSYNDHCENKIVADLNEHLPLDDASFESVTAVFILNYITNIELLLSEIHRVLLKNGIFVAVLSVNGVNEWQQQKEVTTFNESYWNETITSSGFKVETLLRDGLCFFICRKTY